MSRRKDASMQRQHTPPCMVGAGGGSRVVCHAAELIAIVVVNIKTIPWDMGHETKTSSKLGRQQLEHTRLRLNVGNLGSVEREWNLEKDGEKTCLITAAVRDAYGMKTPQRAVTKCALERQKGNDLS